MTGSVRRSSDPWRQVPVDSTSTRKRMMCSAGLYAAPTQPLSLLALWDSPGRERMREWCTTGDHTPLAHLEAHQGERWRHKQPESRMRLQQAGQKSSVGIAQAYVFLQDM